MGTKDATVLLQVPGTQQPESETLAVLKLIGVAPGSWISADIDNRTGQESAVLNLVALSTWRARPGFRSLGDDYCSYDPVVAA